jgi:hypothetical protein
VIVLAVGARRILALAARHQATGKLDGYRSPVSLFENNKEALRCDLDGHLLRLEGLAVGRAQILASLPGGVQVELKVDVVPADRMSLAWEDVTLPAEQKEASHVPR